MTETFFELSKENQRAILVSSETILGLNASIIEKDLWVCWLLDKVFSFSKYFVFKGGTSLSKAYGLIKRFSEDIDITIDYRIFRDEINLDTVTRSQLKKISKQLTNSLTDYIKSDIKPYLQSSAHKAFPKNIKDFIIKVDNDNHEAIQFYYPSVLSNNENLYLRDHILLEFGTRNNIIPFEQHTITSLLENTEISLVLPQAQVKTLSPYRTFWEKATLCHVECQRDKLTENPDRLSRHWYDLYIMEISQLGKNLLNEKNILEDVIKIKKAFYNSSHANYDDCLNGNFRIIPKAGSLNGLKQDYHAMIDAGMFYETPPSIDKIINSLKGFESQINNHYA